MQRTNWLPSFSLPACLISTIGLLIFLTSTAGFTSPAGRSSSPSSPSPVTPPVVQGTGLVTIESDLQQADNQTGVVTATGNVRITYPERGMVATSRQAQYFSKEGRLVLSGDVDVIDADGQRIQAERLVYSLDQERFLAQPSQGKQVTSKLRLSLPAGKKTGAPIP
jgi:lipopolysaccharide export system protein LptA